MIAMYACICHAVTTSAVELAVLSGADTADKVSEATRAGTGCGECHEVIDGIIELVSCPLRALHHAS